jgi:hypothetical protein
MSFYNDRILMSLEHLNLHTLVISGHKYLSLERFSSFRVAEGSSDLNAAISREIPNTEC